MGGVRLLVVAVIAALLCIAEGRPQTDDQRFESLPARSFGHSARRPSRETSSQPVRPFSQSSQREGPPESLPVRPFSQYETQGGGSQRVSSQPVRPFSQSASADHAGRQTPREHQRREEDLYQSRAHSAPLNPHITLQSDEDRQHQRHQHHQTQPADNRNRDETPNWSTGHVRLDPKHNLSGPGTGDGRGHAVGQHSSSTPLHRDNRRTASPPEQKGKGGTRSQQGGADRVLPVRMGTVEGPTEGVGQGKSESGTEEGIVFPGPTKDGGGGMVTTRMFTPQVGKSGPNCAKGSTFCVSPETYPSEYLKTVLQNEAGGLKEFFGRDLLLNDTTLVQRIDSEDENPLCQSVEQVVYPKMAQNKEDKWLYVVNQDQYIQGVRVEKCLKPESECLLTKSFPLGYKTVCRQKYIYRRMLALNDDGKALTDTFRLPSCCSCFVKTVGGGERKR